MSRALAIQLFGIDAALSMANAVGSDGKPDWRGIFEIKPAVMQCNKVIGQFKADTICYICGFPIPAVSPASHELHVECEHVLPVAEARWYLDLYDGSPDQDIGRLSLEYAYAHRVCNQAKSDDSFIRADDEARISFDKPATLSLLNGIKARASRAKEKGFPDPNGYLGKISTLDTKARSDEIYRQKIDPILKSVNVAEPGLAVLSRVASVVDDTRLKPAAREAYKPFSDPAYQKKRETFNAEFETFRRKHESAMGRIAERMFGDARNEWTNSVKTMIEAENENFLRDWFVIVYKNSRVDETGAILDENPNAFTLGGVYAEFKMKLRAYKLFPYISNVVNSELIKAKCSIIEFIGAALSRFKTGSAMLKTAGIFIEKSEVENVVGDGGAEMCVTYEKKRVAAMNREEGALARSPIEVPNEIFTEEESFLDAEGNPVPPEELNMDSELVRRLVGIHTGDTQLSPEFVLDASPAVGEKRKRGQGRTKRAKLFRRTKRAHRPGLSKKLKRRSYRKRRMGKQTTKTRY